MKQLRYYQEKAHAAILEEFQKGVQSTLLCMATGTGKTFTTTSFIQEQGYQKVLWLTHKEELIDQSALALMLSLAPEPMHEFILWYAKQCKGSVIKMIKNLTEASFFHVEEQGTINWLNKNIGIIKQEMGQYDKRVVVASVQTAVRRQKELRKRKFDLIVIDEAHLALSKSWVNVVDLVRHDDIAILGLTATPERMDGVAMSNMFQSIAYTYNIRDAINDKNLCNIKARRVKTNVNLDQVRTTGGELNQGDLKIVNCPERNNLICDEIIENATGRKSLVFCVDIAHAVMLTQTMKNRGINADVIVSDKEICPDRRSIIRGFTHGKTDVLVNVDILTTGFDYPEIGCIAMARPTKSKNLYIQIVGRGTRLKSDAYVEQFGQELLLLDFVDVTSKHAVINAYELDKGKKAKERVFVTDEEREKLFQAEQRRERETKVDRITDITTEVDLMQLPEWDYEKMYGMKHAPITEPQREQLRKLGYDVDRVDFDKEQAFQIIGSQPAGARQVALLKIHGYDTSRGVTYYQAATAMKNIQERASKKLKEQRKQRKLSK